MLIKVGAAISMSVQYLQLRGNIYQFRIRVPQDLELHYGKREIRKSLRTSNRKEATKLAEIEARKYQAEFKVLSGGNPVTPQDVATAGRMLAEQWDNDLGLFMEFVVDPLREKHADGDEERYYESPPEDYLTPVQLEAGRVMTKPNVFRLSDALALYLKIHQRGEEKRFAQSATRDWNGLIALVGDIELEKLSRAHARAFVDHLLAKGYKTGTTRRTLNTLRAIMRVAITEKELQRTDPFQSLKIQGEGKDKQQVAVATPEQLKDMAQSFLPDVASPPALIALIQMETGARVGDVSGLGIDDVFLDAEIPYAYFRNRPWRSLKTRESERRVPVVGIALDALKAALKLPRKGLGLFESYAKYRGNNSASAAVNRRLQKWDITSHSFRHTMKDRLREAGCPKDIRDAIQGHSSGDVAETYGQGHTLKTMQGWLQKVAVEVGCAE